MNTDSIFIQMSVVVANTQLGQKYDIKAKSILQKVLPGVQGLQRSQEGHLSETVRSQMELFGEASTSWR